MSLAALIIGVIAQIFFAGLQGLIVVFSAAAIANHNELTPFQDRLLATLMLLLPQHLAGHRCLAGGWLHQLGAVAVPFLAPAASGGIRVVSAVCV